MREQAVPCVECPPDRSGNMTWHEDRLCEGHHRLQREADMDKATQQAIADFHQAQAEWVNYLRDRIQADQRKREEVAQ